MATGETSLRVQVERLVGETRDERMRVRFIARSRKGATRRVCMQIDWTGGALSVFFFRHADGSWYLFPPDQRAARLRNVRAAV
ncbi:hypothetical protein AWB74_07622 [Caballeronia arvi]|uniref:Uncharacterized protein n=1 Tax=Caballeronia arvi TaxID=1777135 RepID=A0A158KZU6_9BURK|nr:hypothetical protein [Caballeronia arvi]SAL86243.1 hypothetical protein AWB74_07622 [Caballeronia arvi]